MNGKIQSKSLRTLGAFLRSGLVASGMIFFSPSGHAAEPPEETEDSWEEKFIEEDLMVSDWFDGIANGIDLFLVGRKITTRRNETSVKLQNATYFTNDGKITNSPSIGVNLRLPNVEDYWNLKFTSYDETKDRGVRDTVLRQTPRENNYGATVGLLGKLGNVRTAFQPRIELTDPLKVGHSLSFESLAEFKTYRISPRLEFYANPDKGAGVFQALNFNFQLTKIYSFGWINEGEYVDKVHTYTVSNGFSIGRPLTRRMYISTGIYFTSNNRPSYHLESYAYAISFSHELYKKILEYSITPQLAFNKDSNFTGIPGASLNIGLNF